jgi:thiol-disulfide isomerase/thioredoxin
VNFIRIWTFLLVVLGIACSRQTQKELLTSLKADQIDSLVSARSGDKAVLVNVWATWCGPCVEEFPHLVKLATKYQKDADVLFISADFPEQRSDVLAFLNKQGVTQQSFLKDDLDETFINALDSTWTGSIPVTIIYNKNGDKVFFHEGEMTFDAFEKELLSAINN